MTQCTICLEDITETPYVLNCKHVYHKECITRWLSTSLRCPLCRATVDPDSQYVRDGILSEQRRIYIENTRAVCVWSATGLEWLLPSVLQGYGQAAQDYLRSEEGSELLQNVQPGLPIQLLCNLGLKGAELSVRNIRAWLWGRP